MFIFQGGYGSKSFILACLVWNGWSKPNPPAGTNTATASPSSPKRPANSLPPTLAYRSLLYPNDVTRVLMRLLIYQLLTHAPPPPLSPLRCRYYSWSRTANGIQMSNNHSFILFIAGQHSTFPSLLLSIILWHCISIKLSWLVEEKILNSSYPLPLSTVLFLFYQLDV